MAASRGAPEDAGEERRVLGTAVLRWAAVAEDGLGAVPSLAVHDRLVLAVEGGAMWPPRKATNCNGPRPVAVRCAIYTRKSTDEGLDGPATSNRTAR